MKTGKIIKGIAGFYYVHIAGSGVYECRAKGIFRKENVKPLVGDDVRIDILDEEKKTGSVAEILPRKNALIRPAVANIDQALILFACASPGPNFNLLDRFLVMMEHQQVPVLIGMNKTDLVSPETLQEVRSRYAASAYPLFFFSAKTGEGTEALKERLLGKTSTVAGPSGAGKSTLTNLLAPHANMETGLVSEKIQRGRHTTRHSQLIALAEETYLCDTPGFSSLLVEAEELDSCFPEFRPLKEQCRFRDCTHRNEPDCAVKAGLSAGAISEGRYANYLQMMEELQSKKRY